MCADHNIEFYSMYSSVMPHGYDYKFYLKYFIANEAYPLCSSFKNIWIYPVLFFVFFCDETFCCLSCCIYAFVCKFSSVQFPFYVRLMTVRFLKLF